MTTPMQLIAQPVAPPSIQTYADTVNSKFYKSASHYITLEDRLVTSLNTSWKHKELQDSITEFQKKYPQLHSWSDLTLCKAQECKFSEIVIDTTLQREFDLYHACRIIKEFEPMEVYPICVYQDPAIPGKYVCWDGQHTAIVLYTILKRILNNDPEQCLVPIVIYPCSLKSQMRNTFIKSNTTNKKDLDQIDILHQQIYSYRTDGTVTPELLEVERKQTALENAHMFATHSKFGDSKQPGALTVLTEFVNRKYPAEVTEDFCKYFYTICKSSRPVAPKESWLMYDYFKIVRQVGIDVTDQYIYEVTASLNKAFNGSFDADQLYSRALISYQEWWRLNKPNPDGTLWGITYNEKLIGLTFLLEQVRKHAKVPVPYLKHPLWTIPKEDLF